MSTKDTLYLVDGSGFIFRAYHVMPPFTRPGDGTPVGAVYGFVNMMVKLIDDFQTSHLAVIFDAKRHNFRNDIYDQYKANRDATPEDLIPQFPLIREATRHMNIPGIELDGFEADDLIASYAELACQQGRDVVIVSSDKDLMQLVNDHIRMYDPMKNIFIDRQGVIDKFGVPPEKVIDVQSLAGDSVDNVPGVPGIGIKTAAQLITEYGSLETLLDRAGDIKQPKRREKLINHRQDAEISKKLVTLARDVDVPMGLDDLKIGDQGFINDQLIIFLKDQGFKSIITRLGQKMTASANNPASATPINATPSKNDSTASARTNFTQPSFPSPADNTYTLITDMDVLESWIDTARQSGILCVDTETTSLKTMTSELVGISLSSQIGRAAYIPLNHKTAAQDLFGAADGAADMDDLCAKQLPQDQVLAALKPILQDPSIIKIAHNMKYDWQIFANYGIDVGPYDDTMLLSYVLNGTEHGHSMDELSELYCGHSPIKFEDVAGKGKSQITFDYVAIDQALDYAAEDAEITLRLYHLFKPRLAQEGKTTLYEQIERPLVRVLARMERQGVMVDAAILQAMSVDFAKQLAVLEKEIHDMAGQEFNVASPKQIGQILFDHLGLKGGKKTKTGDWSTNASILEDLAAKPVDDGGHPILAKILEWRSMAKLKSTYTDALQGDINPKTGRVHSAFVMTGTSTGRLASRDPNLQNIPIRTEAGRKIRTAFIAAPGHKILSIDYSQVELRLAAELAGIENLKQAFRDGADIHALTAAQIMNIPQDQVTPDQRRAAKAINFGIIYGISAWGLANQLAISPSEAGEFIKRYLARFPELGQYMDRIKAQAHDLGYVSTLFGRKCTIPFIHDKNPARRAGAERQAINAPLQGTAADIMKKAMVKMQPALDAANLSAKMILQIHDELIFEVPDDQCEATLDLVKHIMENVVHLDTPLIAEGKFAPSWAAAH